MSLTWYHVLLNAALSLTPPGTQQLMFPPLLAPVLSLLGVVVLSM